MRVAVSLVMERDRLQSQLLHLSAKAMNFKWDGYCSVTANHVSKLSGNYALEIDPASVSCWTPSVH